MYAVDRCKFSEDYSAVGNDPDKVRPFLEFFKNLKTNLFKNKLISKIKKFKRNSKIFFF
jgi:hypothetical protein